MVAKSIASERPRARWRPALAALLAALSGLALSGCGSADNSQFALAVIGDPEDPFLPGPGLPLAGQLTRAATAEGLVSFDEQGRVVPALADRWIVTDDGQSYIFRLRDGHWLNGEPLTARAAKAALDRAIRALRDTPLGLDLAGVDEVRTMAGRVIEIRLKRPLPYFLQILAQPELGLRREKQGDGPMILEREGTVARFIPIEPSRLGLPAVDDWDERTRPLEMVALPASQAVARFNEGKVDLVLGGRVQDFPLTGSVGILRGTIQLDPVVGLFGLHVARAEGFLADPQNRGALAMAIDRAALIEPFGVSGWTATTLLVPASIDGDLSSEPERWADLPIERRREMAAARVQQWRTGTAAPQAAGTPSPTAQSEAARENKSESKGAGAAPAAAAPALTLWLPDGPGSDILFRRLVEDTSAIGLRLTRAANSEGADLRLVDEVARYPRAGWFFNQLSCAARRGICDPGADALIREALGTLEAAPRAALLEQASTRLTQANLFIPFGTPIRWSLVRGDVKGFAPNAWAWHPLMPLAWVHR